MKPAHSLRTRLILAYAGLIALGFAGLALLAGGQISSSAIQDYQGNLVTQAELVARGLSEVMEKFMEREISQSDITQVVDGYAGQLGVRVTLVDRDGRAWLDSSGNLPAGNLSADAEIIAATEGRSGFDQRPDESGQTTVYAAAPIREDGDLVSIVRLAAPVSAAQSLIIQRWLALGAGVLFLGLLALLASLWLAASFTRPLSQLRTATLQMAGGDLASRLPEGREDEFGQVALAFNRMADQVQAMLAEQQAFAGNASHELRTPLTTIRLRSEALRYGALDPATAQQYIAEIDDEVDRLGGLVEDLILLSRLDTGRTEPGHEQIDLVRLARHLATEMGPRLGAAGVQLHLQLPSNLPPITASLNHLRVVFRNLLDNALKYTPAGGSITWQLAAEDTHLLATISDTGRGVTAGELPHLFERFYRADTAHTRQVPGVGLGLSLVQGIVQFYGGRITVTSPRRDQGTTFQVWWPYTHPPAGGQ